MGLSQIDPAHFQRFPVDRGYRARRGSKHGPHAEWAFWGDFEASFQSLAERFEQGAVFGKSGMRIQSNLFCVTGGFPAKPDFPFFPGQTKGFLVNRHVECQAKTRRDAPGLAMCRSPGFRRVKRP